MGEFPNKATQFKSGDRAVELGRQGGLKGGQSTSFAKKYASQLRYIKQSGDTDAEIEFLAKRMEDPNVDIIHIKKLLDDLIKRNPEDKTLLSAIAQLTNVHKAHFGDKKIVQSTSIHMHMDVPLSDEEKEELKDVIDI